MKTELIIIQVMDKIKKMNFKIKLSKIIYNIIPVYNIEKLYYINNNHSILLWTNIGQVVILIGKKCLNIKTLNLINLTYK